MRSGTCACYRHVGERLCELIVVEKQDQRLKGRHLGFRGAVSQQCEIVNQRSTFQVREETRNHAELSVLVSAVLEGKPDVVVNHRPPLCAGWSSGRRLSPARDSSR